MSFTQLKRFLMHLSHFAEHNLNLSGVHRDQNPSRHRLKHAAVRALSSSRDALVQHHSSRDQSRSSPCLRTACSDSPLAAFTRHVGRHGCCNEQTCSESHRPCSPVAFLITLLLVLWCPGPFAAGLLALGNVFLCSPALAQELAQLPPIPTEFPELGDLQLPSIEKVLLCRLQELDMCAAASKSHAAPF